MGLATRFGIMLSEPYLNTSKMMPKAQNSTKKKKFNFSHTSIFWSNYGTYKRDDFASSRADLRYG